MQSKAVGIALLALHHIFLAVALQLENAQLGFFSEFVRVIRPAQARDVALGIVELNGVFLLFDVAEHRSFANLDFCFLQIGFGLLKIGCALLFVAALFCYLLFDLMRQIAVLSLRFAR